MKTFFSMKGRYDRAQFFFAILGLFIIWNVLRLVLENTMTFEFGIFSEVYVLSLVSIPFIVIASLQVVKRLHDFGKSGHYFWILFVPFLQFILLFTLFLRKGIQKDGLQSSSAFAAIFQAEQQKAELAGNKLLKVWKSIGLSESPAERQEWSALLTSETIEFNSLNGTTSDRDNVSHFIIDRSEATVRMELFTVEPDLFVARKGEFLGPVIIIKSIDDVPGTNSAPEIKQSIRFLTNLEEADTIKAWMVGTPRLAREVVEMKVNEAVIASNLVKKNEMSTAVRLRGGALIAWGISCLLLPDLFDMWWGIAFIALGLINVAFPLRAMFIINGLALIAVGCWNTYASLMTEIDLWRWIGLAQVFIGFEECQRFNHYSPDKVLLREKNKVIKESKSEVN